MNNRREIFGWAMYDWANSAFSTTVVVVFFGPYLTSIAQSASRDGFIYLFGIPIKYNSLFSYCGSVSVGLQVLFLPVLGALADYSRARKRMLMLFAALGSAATVAMFFVKPGLHWFGGALFIMANLSFGASMVFYNAYLPDIASPDRRDGISSRGFAFGYAGGGLLLVLNLLLFEFRERLGLDSGLAVRICLASAGFWWIGFSLLTFKRLRSRRAARALPPGQSYFTVGFKQLANTLSQVSKFPQTIRYLLAYLIYNDGIQTVILMTTVFASDELKMVESELILIILMVQGVALAGSLAFGRLAEKMSTKRAIIVSLIIWSGITLYAFFVRSHLEFWFLAASGALVLGGSQALSRSLFSQMIPRGREAEFFSFYEVSDRFTSWLGPLLFGLANQFLGGLRYGILSLLALFLVGLLLLTSVNVARAIREAQTADLREAFATA
jgi:UMF1 family MFS transporter